jgi:hypothetical protein
VLENTTRDAVNHPAIDGAVLLGNTRVIDCDAVEARDLLACARIHCPSAVPRITEEMLLDGLTHKLTPHVPIGFQGWSIYSKRSR